MKLLMCCSYTFLSLSVGFGLALWVGCLAWLVGLALWFSSLVWLFI